MNPVPQATSSVRRGGESRQRHHQLFPLLRPTGGHGGEQTLAEPPVVVLRSTPVVVLLHRLLEYACAPARVGPERLRRPRSRRRRCGRRRLLDSGARSSTSTPTPTTTGRSSRWPARRRRRARRLARRRDRAARDAIDLRPSRRRPPARRRRRRRPARAARARGHGACPPAALELGERVGSASSSCPSSSTARCGGGRRPAFFSRGGPDRAAAPDRRRRARAGLRAARARPARPARCSWAPASRSSRTTSCSRRTTLEVARAIAAAVRESGGGLPGLQALGVPLAGSGRVQVSMNLIDLDRVALHEVVARVVREAADARGRCRERGAGRPAAGGRSARGAAGPLLLGARRVARAGAEPGSSELDRAPAERVRR